METLMMFSASTLSVANTSQSAWLTTPPRHWQGHQDIRHQAAQNQDNLPSQIQLVQDKQHYHHHRQKYQPNQVKLPAQYYPLKPPLILDKLQSNQHPTE